MARRTATASLSRQITCGFASYGVGVPYGPGAVDRLLHPTGARPAAPLQPALKPRPVVETAVLVAPPRDVWIASATMYVLFVVIPCFTLTAGSVRI